MKKLKLIISAVLISSLPVFAHGEQKPGPHGGVIRMPGAFHTEVVLLSPRKLNVFLLDMHFKSPTTVNSQVDVSHENHKANCVKANDHFSCEFETEVLSQKGRLVVKAIRMNRKGSEAIYTTPLKI